MVVPLSTAGMTRYSGMFCCTFSKSVMWATIRKMMRISTDRAMFLTRSECAVPAKQTALQPHDTITHCVQHSCYSKFTTLLMTCHTPPGCA